ncbi:hypothetical protein HYDPIDRAFT_118106 [Hydnomerulius pinastri MD-312]|uniref:C2H2-type domain-containing protein n=1 Tax=Hydnomerulius pinastri MD-312 TaxID=994086 RepID=A0A0C9W984_9AGAM|nr:hypothetical protein HYDPIDRAFT_118106 [Hydnomerulius pinastri MD-312]
MSRPPVPLPSIRDIFPEMAMHGNSSHHGTKPFGTHTNVSDRPLPPPISPSRSRDAKQPQEEYIFHPRFHPKQAPPSPPPSSSSSESAVHRPTHFQPQRNSPTSKPPSYSFNVLRTDPVTSSLEHIASSTTLRHRGSATTHPGPPAGIANGSAPVFRVEMGATEPRSGHHRHHRGVQEVMIDPRDRHTARDVLSPTTAARESDLLHNRSQHASSIVSFSVSDPPSSASTLMSNDGRRPYLRSSEIVSHSLQGEGRGKKHQCPHCGKRFNRPSSMKIHVNTHTGAKPYRCPFPGCGREFNVNSNMRRHWRNHSRSGPTRLSEGDGQSMYNSRSGSADVLGQHHALMSPPATNSSMSEGNSEDEDFSDEEGSHYPMDIDDYDEDGKEDELDEVNPMASGSSSSDLSAWSRSTSPVRGAPAYGHHQHIRHPSSLSHAGLSSPQSHTPTSEYIYRPSIPAYAISCTDSRVSTALRPAFTRESQTRSYPREKRTIYSSRP